MLFFQKKNLKNSPKSTGKIFSLGRSRKKIKNLNNHSVPINGLIPGLAVHFAKCCYPLPGDRIVAIATTGKGVTVHTIDCMTFGGFCRQPRTMGGRFMECRR